MREPSRSAGGVGSAGGDVVVVHSSDLHVDDGYTARAHGGDGTAGLAGVLDAARAVAADVVILAGDVFEHNRLPLALIDRAARLLGEAGLPVVILPGNHDPAIPDSVYHRGGITEPHNVHVLGVTHDEAVELAVLGLTIWGRAHRDYGDMAPLEAPPARVTRWHVVTAHGHYEARPDRSRPHHPSWLISDDDIAATGADYVALGHWNTAVRAGDGAVQAHYSGSPEFAGTVNVVRLTAAGAVAVARAPIRWGSNGGLA